MTSIDRKNRETAATPWKRSELSAVHWLSPDQAGEWDAFVAQHPLGLVYHLSAWQKVLETAFQHIRGRFLVLRDERGEIKAGLPLYTVSSWLLKNRTVSVPFATMCDPLVSTKEEFDLLWPVIENQSREQQSQRIEIRTRCVATECVPSILTAGARYKHHYLPLNESTDVLFRSFHQSCVRRRVEKARRGGLIIEERQDDQSLRVFHALLVATRRKRLLPPMPFAFFEAIYRYLSPNHVSLYLGLSEGEPVAGLMALKFRDMWTMEYNGDADNAAPGANQFLCWDTIQRAKNSGARYYSFGRTAIDNESLLDYKRRWATVEEDLVDFTNVPGSMRARSEESATAVSEALYITAKKVLRYAPVGMQKSFGDFCYRHLG